MQFQSRRILVSHWEAQAQVNPLSRFNVGLFSMVVIGAVRPMLFLRGMRDTLDEPVVPCAKVQMAS